MKNFLILFVVAFVLEVVVYGYLEYMTSVQKTNGFCSWLGNQMQVIKAMFQICGGVVAALFLASVLLTVIAISAGEVPHDTGGLVPLLDKEGITTFFAYGVCFGVLVGGKKIGKVIGQKIAYRSSRL